MHTAETEKQNVKSQCKTFINNNRKLNRNFSSCTQEEQEWILNYLSPGKNPAPYEMMIEFDSLDIPPEQKIFFQD